MEICEEEHSNCSSLRGQIIDHESWFSNRKPAYNKRGESHEQSLQQVGKQGVSSKEDKENIVILLVNVRLQC